MTCCPLLFVDAGTWEMVEMVEFWEQGLPPVAGGMLDQTAYFVAFAKETMRQRRAYREG